MNYFHIKTNVKDYDCDSNNRLKISAALRYMQQSSSEHLNYLGYPYETLLEQNMVFLLSKMCVKVHRMPTATQDLIVGTVPTMTQGARFVREFAIDTPGGERLVSALSLWILVDPASRRVLRPSNFPYELPFRESMLRGAIGDIRIPRLLEEGQQLKTSIPIRYSHIDCNGHVNNSIYADFVCDTIPYGALCSRGIDTLVISYQNEAKWGDQLEIRTSELSAGEYYLSGSHNDCACFEALVQLRKVSEETGLAERNE